MKQRVMSNKNLLWLFAILWVIHGCTRKVNEPTSPKDNDKIFVVNANPETMGIIGIPSLTYRDDILETGTTPNYLFESDNKIYLVNSGFQGTPTVQIIDPVYESVLDEIQLPSGSNPMRAVINRDNGEEWLYFTSWTRHKVYKLSLSNYEVTDSVSVGKSPDGITVLNGTLYVASTFYDQTNYTPDTGKVYKVDLQSFEKRDSVVVGLNPFIVVPDPTGNLLVGGGNYGDTGYLTKLSVDTLRVIQVLSLSSPPQAIFTTDDAIWVPCYNKSIVKIDPSTFGVIDEYSVADSLPDGAFIMGADISTDGKYIYLAGFQWQGDNFVLIFDTAHNYVSGRVYTGPDKGTQLIKYFSPQQ